MSNIDFESKKLTDIQEAMEKMRSSLNEFRANPSFNMCDKLKNLVCLSNDKAYCPFCDKELFIEFKTMLVCKECPYGFYVTSMRDTDDSRLNISKFTISFNCTAVRVCYFYDINQGVILYQRLTDEEAASNMRFHDFLSDTFIRYDNMDLNYKDINAIINKLKTYLTFG